MDIAQLLNTNGASAAQSGKSPASGETGFAQLLQQLASAARLNTGDKALLGNQTLPDNQALLGDSASLGEGELSIEALLADLESTGELSDSAIATLATLMQGVNTTAMPGASAGSIAPLAQQIAQALEAQASSLPAANAVNANMSSSGDPFDLATIRQRLDLIANAQQGGPAQNPLAGINLAGGDDASALRHRQLTAQGLQSLASQNSLAQHVEGQQLTAQAVSTAEVLANASGNDSAQTGRGNDGLQSLALVGNTANTGSHTNGVQPALTANPAATLSAPLASAQWQQGLGQQLIALHQRGGQRVDLHLHPAELGPLSVSLKVDDQLAQAQFFSTNPQVRAAIEQAIPQLREALEENGIQLGEAMVGEHRHDDGHTGSGNEAALIADRAGAEKSSADDEPLLMEQAERLLDNAGNGVDLYA